MINLFERCSQTVLAWLISDLQEKNRSSSNRKCQSVWKRRKVAYFTIYIKQMPIALLSL